MGDKVGRIHLGRQDLDDLQTRKMKGLKRGRPADVGDGKDMAGVDLTLVSGGNVDDEVDDETDRANLKRPRID